MTSCIAWLGADSRGQTSIYFASDSRISWDDQDANWDTGRKLFATMTTAEIFGFTGYVLLPQTILTRACDFIDRQLRPKICENDPRECANWLFSLVSLEVKSHPRRKGEDFTIFYAIRKNDGMQATFYLYQITWNSESKKIDLLPIDMPSKSSVLKIHGTGRISVINYESVWERSDQGGTSRTIFSAFCDALNSNEDSKSGGEPQLIGLYRTGNSRLFGVVTHNGASLQGVLNPPILPDKKLEWRDSLFQRVKSNGSILKNAQHHSRPKQIKNI